MSGPQVVKHSISWKRFEKDIHKLANQILTNEIKMRWCYSSVYGIPRGGLVIATRLSHLLNVPLINVPLMTKLTSHSTLICDDVSDTGETLKEYNELFHIATLYRKNHTKIEPRYCVRTINKHIIFPWERG